MNALTDNFRMRTFSYSVAQPRLFRLQNADLAAAQSVLELIAKADPSVKRIGGFTEFIVNLGHDQSAAFWKSSDVRAAFNELRASISEPHKELDGSLSIRVEVSDRNISAQHEVIATNYRARWPYEGGARAQFDGRSEWSD